MNCECKVNPCHRDTARRQVTNGGIIYNHGQPTRDGLPDSGLSERLRWASDLRALLNTVMNILHSI